MFKLCCYHIAPFSKQHWNYRRLTSSLVLYCIIKILNTVFILKTKVELTTDNKHFFCEDQYLNWSKYFYFKYYLILTICVLKSQLSNLQHVKLLSKTTSNGKLVSSIMVFKYVIIWKGCMKYSIYRRNPLHSAEV